MSKYIATVFYNEFPGNQYSPPKHLLIGLPNIEEAKNGFWVNSNFEFTNKGDALIWFPASSVLFVKKFK